MITAFRLSVGSVGWGSGVGASEETGDEACEEAAVGPADPDVWGADEAALDISWLSLDSPGLTMVTFGFVSSMYTLSAVSARESRGLVVVSTWTVVPAKAGVVFSVEEAAGLPEFPPEKGADTRPELKESPEAPDMLSPSSPVPSAAWLDSATEISVLILLSPLK